MRTFPTGATRDSDSEKPDYTKSLSPLALQRFGAYMLKHNLQADGETRALDNWKRGIPQGAYVASLGRHFMDLWLHVDGHPELRGSRTWKRSFAPCCSTPKDSFTSDWSPAPSLRRCTPFHPNCLTGNLSEMESRLY